MTGPALDVGLRLAVAAALGTGLVAGRAGLAAWRDRRRRRAIGGPALPELALGEATVLLFTGSLCADCIRQKEILEEVQTRLGGWRIHEVRAAREQQLAARFGVQSVPATVVLDPKGQPMSVNYGLQDIGVMVGQLQALLT
jgi:thiol-disulfide isomerase/thioredoxin